MDKLGLVIAWQHRAIWGKEWNWISVTLYGILNPTNGSMLPPDFAWGKVVMFHCFASNIMELVLGFLC